MEKAETPHVTELFEQGSPLDARIVGGHLFVAQVRDATGHPPLSTTRKQLIEGVGKIVGGEPEALSGHRGVLARALVAWYAARSGTASVREVGTWFGVSGATLGKGIRHYRRVSPELFNKKFLPGIQSTDAPPGDDGA